jgi:hypothetical protein
MPPPSEINVSPLSTLLLILIQSRREGIPRTRPRHLTPLPSSPPVVTPSKDRAAPIASPTLRPTSSHELGQPRHRRHLHALPWTQLRPGRGLISVRRFDRSRGREGERSLRCKPATTGRRPYRTRHSYDHRRTGRPDSRGKRGGGASGRRNIPRLRRLGRRTAPIGR